MNVSLVPAIAQVCSYVLVVEYSGSKQYRLCWNLAPNVGAGGCLLSANYPIMLNSPVSGEHLENRGILPRYLIPSPLIFQ